MTEFEEGLNELLVNALSYFLKYEESSLKSISAVPITVSEAHVIEAVGKLGGSAAVGDIAAALKITMPSATIAVKKLEGKGMLTKRQCTDDGRRTLISLTEAGARIDRAHGIFHRRMVRDCSRDLDDNEREALLSAVSKLCIFFRSKVEA